MSEKPFKGTIDNWHRVFIEDKYIKPTDQEHLGYYILGQFINHPEFAGKTGHTSLVTDYSGELELIQTLNSEYALGENQGPDLRWNGSYCEEM